MGSSSPTPGQLRRLADEVDEAGLDLGPHRELLLEELACARHPVVHERRVLSYGAFVAPTTDPATWDAATTLTFDRRPIGRRGVEVARRFADGVSTWVARGVDGAEDEFIVLDRPAASERDLVVIAEVLGAWVVQRHPSGVVRVVGEQGVHRWDGYSWHTEPHVSTWMEAFGACAAPDDHDLVETLLEFAVHDLGARNIGATLVFRADPARIGVESRLPTPPPLTITNPTDLAPLRHVLSQVDGAVVFDGDGRLVEMGARLVPSPEAEAGVDGFRGMRHTSALRYSVDDPTATVIVVSEDGPVTVLRNGKRVGASLVEHSHDADVDRIDGATIDATEVA
jgi:hypothetical protein